MFMDEFKYGKVAWENCMSFIMSKLILNIVRWISSKSVMFLPVLQTYKWNSDTFMTIIYVY